MQPPPESNFTTLSPPQMTPGIHMQFQDTPPPHPPTTYPQLAWVNQDSLLSPSASVQIFFF